MQNVIQKGAATTTGGVVLEGNDGILVEGKIFTSIGQMASCPQCKQGQGPIVPDGPRTVDLPAGPAALHNDVVACGCPPGGNRVIAMQGSTFGGAQGGGAASARAASASPASSATSTPASPSSAPTIDAANAYWPPYDFAQGKELEVVYTQDVIETAILTLHEANEFYTNLWVEINGKSTAGYGKSGYDMVKATFEGAALAKGLGGLGVQAYTKNIKGVDYVIIKGYKKHLKTLLAGNIWKASNPNIVRLGLGKHGTRYTIKVGVVVDVAFAAAVNAVDVIVRDASFAEFVGNTVSDIIKALIVAGIIIAAAPTVTITAASGTALVALSVALGLGVDAVDGYFGLSEKFTKYVKETMGEG